MTADHTADQTAATQLDESSNGSTITVSAGDTFQLFLPESPTTGYRWILVSDLAPLITLVDDCFREPAPPAGASGSHLWVFHAAQAGEMTIELHYARAWETGATPSQTFTLNVQVKS